MKHIEVVAAVIQKGDSILATQRGYGDLKGRWEFPGGKIESGEDREKALIREIQEELKVHIDIVRYVTTVEYTYPTFHMTMHAYLCELEGNYELVEHSEARWLNETTLYEVDWLEADLPIVDLVQSEVFLSKKKS